MEDSEADEGELLDKDLKIDNEVLKKSKLGLSPTYVHFIGGFCGGIAPTVLLHPFELVKIRLAAASPSKVVVTSNAADANAPYHSLSSAVRSVYKENGIRAFYRGVGANVLGNATAWGSYLAIYNKSKHFLSDYLNYDGTHALPSIFLFALGMSAGVVTLAVTNPIWVAKTRLCLQYGSPNANMSRNSATSYTGLVDCLHKTYKFEGMRGLYRGFAPGLIGTSYGAFQITLYDRSKFIYAKWKNKPLHEPLSVAEYILLSSSSKMLATTIMFPYQVVRVRLQDHNRQWFGVRDVVKTTWNGEGLRGFYRGLVPNLLRVTPHTALTLTIYEYVQHYFK